MDRLQTAVRLLDEVDEGKNDFTRRLVNYIRH